MNPTPGLKRPFSGLTETETVLTMRIIKRIMSINIEGLAQTKELILSSLIKTNNIDILALQETHRSDGSRKPKIEGIKLL